MSKTPSRPFVPAVAACFVVFACTSVSHRRDVAVPAPLPKPSSGTVYEAAAKVELPDTKPEDHASVHNVFQLGPTLWSGSEPHDEEAFQILKAKGVRTILSVDGKVPDQQLAAKYGMRYVHVPIQYKGITADEIAKIAKTFREIEGPFFVHCFHGKHRGPAAAAIGRLVLDGVPRETAIAEMHRCGTSKSYEGLYQTVAHATIPSASETSAMDWDFPAASPLDGIAGAMVEVSRADDHLKAMSKHEWRPDPSHPDGNALNEATKLLGVFERSVAMSEVQQQPEDFRQWMADSITGARSLRDALQALKDGKGRTADADAAYKAVSKTCTACHDVYRN